MIDDFDSSLPRAERGEPLEPRLAEAARAFNPPPATPREAMWARIAAARAEARDSSGTAARAATAAIAADTRVIAIDVARARREGRGPTRTWAILAGTLAAGIALGIFGRDLFSDDAQPQPGMVARGGDTLQRPSARIDSGATSRVAASEGSAVDLGGKKPPVGPIAPQRGIEAGSRVATSTGAPPENNITPAPRNPITPRTPDEPSPRYDPRYAPGGDRNSLYHAAAVQTLSQAEALLVAWRVDAPRDTATARQLGKWARDVLGSTRLLLDSPAASDPRLHDLLDDLELVLAQIVQLSGAPLTEEERALLERSVRARNLLPRIRSAVPAGLSGSATAI